MIRKRHRRNIEAEKEEKRERREMELEDEREHRESLSKSQIIREGPTYVQIDEYGNTM